MRYNPRAWYWAVKSSGQIYSSAAGAAVPAADADYEAWVASGGAATPIPDIASLDDVLARAALPASGLAVPTQAQLSVSVVAAASAACASIVAQIAPDQTHAFAFTNGAAIVNANNGAAPSADPLKTSFANWATAFGAASAAAFATLIASVQKASLDLSAAQQGLSSACASAATAAQLAAGLAVFETAIGSIVAEITAAGVAISAPAAISIKGVNV